MAIKEETVKVEDKYVRWFSDLSKNDVKQVGGKAANLGEMIKLGMPVPQGFAINAHAYEFFLEHTKLKEKIYESLKKLDVEDTAELEKVAKEIREMISNAELPKEIKEEILEAYEVLGVDKSPETASKDVMNILKMQEPSFVAVRSSATAEDSSAASFAGQQQTFLNVKGKNELIDSVKKCFASLFTARSIYYRVKKGFKHEEVLNAVIVQLMIDSEKSGVIFSRDPVTNEENVVTEAVFGLGEGIVSGKIKPDHYVMNREFELIKKEIAEKKIALTRDSAGNTEVVKLTKEKSISQVLTDYEIKRLTSHAIKLEEHYKKGQDIEFGISAGEIFILQTRPITTSGKKQEGEAVYGEFVLSGLAASPGIGVGVVKIIRNLEELSKVKKGDVLVTIMTNPDMVVSMQKSAAIVTDEGGVTSHAAIVSREMGIPAVVGTGDATSKLKDGEIVTVDGFKGKVYEGKVEELKAKKVEILPAVETKTKIKVMVDLPSFAERAAKSQLKEVGLVRLEGIIAESGKHPSGFLKNNEIDKYEEIIFTGIQGIGKYFDKLWVRTSDIRTDEFGNLESAPKEKEANPMLGDHGIRFSLKHPEILKAEIKALDRVDKETGLLLPQVISVEEVEKVKKIMQELNSNTKLGVMIETPASVQIIEELCEEGIEFISFGTNDLTQYTLAVDRGNEDVQNIFDEMHPSILSQLEKVIKTCKKFDVGTSICGQAGSRKEMVEFLVKLGIDSISVNADKAKEISEFVKELEQVPLQIKEEEEKVGKEDKVEEKVPLPDVDKEGEIDFTTESKPITQPVKNEHGKYDVICDECGKQAEVPFKPKPGLPVYCKQCYLRKKEVKEKIEEEKEVDTEPNFDVFSGTTEPTEEEKHEALEKEEKEISTKEELSLPTKPEPDTEPEPEPKPEQPEPPEPEPLPLQKVAKEGEINLTTEPEPEEEEEIEEEPEKDKQSEIQEELEELERMEQEKIDRASEGIENNEDVLDIF